MPSTLSPASVGAQSGGRRRGASVKTLKRMLKKAGLKTTGRKAALTRRAKKAHLKMRGGEDEAMAAPVPPQEGEMATGSSRHRRSRKH